MSEQTLVFPPSTTSMDRREAEECVRQIDYHMDEARRLIYELDVREGWKALGYRSFYQCVINLFSAQKSQLYRQRRAAKVETLISGEGAIGLIPERVLRPLTPYVDQPVVALTLYTIAQQIAGEGAPVTSLHTQAVVDTLTEMLTNGVVTDGEGEQSYLGVQMADSVMAEAQERLKRARQYVREGIAKATGSNLMHNLFPQSPQLKLSSVGNGSVSYRSDNSPSIIVTIPVWMLKSGKLPNVVQLKLLAEDET